MRQVAADEILVAEHEPAVAELIRRYLAKEGLKVRCANTPEQTLAALAAPGGTGAAAVILDLTMPGLDARAIRKLVRGAPLASGPQPSPRGRPLTAGPLAAGPLTAGPLTAGPLAAGPLAAGPPASRRGRPPQAVTGAAPGTPVICLTAGEATQAALGLRPRDIGVGEESCVSRPFGPRTLVERVRAAIRATRAPAAVPPGTGRLRLAPDRRQATMDGTAIALTGTEFDLLSCLLRSAGRTVPRDRLRQEVWGTGGRNGRAVDVYIAQLRAKLGPGHGIRTVRGIGYVMDL